MTQPWPPPPDIDSIQELVATADVEGFIAEGAPPDEYEAVGDVEVGVAGGEALVFEEDGGRHGEGADVEGLALPVAGFVEALEVLGEGEVVLVGGVGLDGCEDGVGSDEAGDVVDVAVGVVSGAAAV